MSKQKRHTPEQIASVLKQQEGGLKVAEICRREGIGEQTFLSLEVEVRRPGCKRGEAAQGIGRGKPTSEAAR
jgi:hypothetical protein